MDKNRKKQLAYLLAARMSIPFDDFRSIRNVGIANFIATDDTRIMKLLVGIDPVQSGSGDPAPDNVRPISGFTGLTVNRTGVNVWDEEWELGVFDNSTGEKVANNSNSRSKNYIRVSAGTSYAFVKPDSSRVFFYGERKNFLSTLVIGSDITSLTPPAGTYYMMFQFSGTTYSNNISINYPSTDTSYHAYQGTTYPVTWQSTAGTVYGGTLDVVSGLLTVTMASVDLGTLTWEAITISADSGNRFFSRAVEDYIKIPQTTAETPNMLCSAYPIKAVWQFNQAVQGITVYTNGSLQVYDPALKDASAADFKTAMSGVQLVYTLATPQTYQLDPVDIQPLLGENNIWADTGDILILDLNY